MKFRDLSRKRDYIAICRGKLSISRFFAEKRRFRDLSRKIANIAISTPPRQTNAPGEGPGRGISLKFLRSKILPVQWGDICFRTLRHYTCVTRIIRTMMQHGTRNINIILIISRRVSNFKFSSSFQSIFTVKFTADCMR